MSPPHALCIDTSISSPAEGAPQSWLLAFGPSFWASFLEVLFSSRAPPTGRLKVRWIRDETSVRARDRMVDSDEIIGVQKPLWIICHQIVAQALGVLFRIGKGSKRRVYKDDIWVVDRWIHSYSHQGMRIRSVASESGATARRGWCWVAVGVVRTWIEGWRWRCEQGSCSKSAFQRGGRGWAGREGKRQGRRERRARFRHWIFWYNLKDASKKKNRKVRQTHSGSRIKSKAKPINGFSCRGVVLSRGRIASRQCHSQSHNYVTGSTFTLSTIYTCYSANEKYPSIIANPPRGVTGPKNLNLSLFKTNRNMLPEKTAPPTEMAMGANRCVANRGCKETASMPNPLNTLRNKLANGQFYSKRPYP